MESHFTNEMVSNMAEHSNAVEQLKQLGTFWIGPDIQLAEKVVVPPKGGVVTGVPVLVSKEQLPKMDITRGSFDSLQWSVRSFLAQSGIDPIFHQQDLSDEMIKKLHDGETVAMPITIINHGERAVEIEGAFMRFYFADDARRLRGDDLKSIIGTELVLEGEEGKDWKIGGLDLSDDLSYLKKEYEGEHDAVCIKLPLSEVKLYIPENPEPLRIKSRKELYEIQEKIPEGIDLKFTIGETTKVKLGENIIGVINTGGYDEGNHIRSPLIDSGFEGKIRTEINGTLDYIELFIYKK